MDSIVVKGCRQHNLKNVSVSIPKSKIVVFVGVSGSGKSSLVFDTIFAEGQRRYLEYLSPDIRKWIKLMPRPEVDFIEGLSPCLAVSQHRGSLSSRSTVATHTDIYDFLAVLYSNIGEQHSPFTGKKLTRYSRQQIVEMLLKEYQLGSKIQLIAPVRLEKENSSQTIQRLLQQGFVRLRINDVEVNVEEGIPEVFENTSVEVVVDRIEMKEGVRGRIGGSIDTVMELSRGILKVQEGKDGPIRFFTEIYVCPESGYTFQQLTPIDFNFNSAKGACRKCQGEGGVVVINPDDSIEWQTCPECKGGRLKAESLACLIEGKGIHQMVAMRVDELKSFLNRLHLSGKEAVIAKELLAEASSRLDFLDQVGLGYLELNRQANTLSEGEAQRVELAALIGAKLSGIIYILDEPSRGLHPRDIERLSSVIQKLQQMGNSVLLVEHHKRMITMADQIVELGPGAGSLGGELVFQGTYSEILKDSASPTGVWLSGKKKLPKAKPRKSRASIMIENLSCHNIQDLSLELPLGIFVGLCGVSGSGKSTLAVDVVAKEMKQWINQGKTPPHIKGYESITRISLAEQNAAHIHARSIPATYVEIMTPLRELLAETKLAKARGYNAARFSLNKKGGRCDACEGKGTVKVPMQFMADLEIPCELCQGTRYNYETLQITWLGLNIAEILNLTVDQALELFKNIPKIALKLEMMSELGLGYITLGQSFKTLSGGEIQRISLVADIASASSQHTLYILDEPSAGLHFNDVDKLIAILHRLTDAGHSVIATEHNLALLGQADWIIEMGPGGGPEGGQVIFEGSPAQLLKANTPTGLAMKSNVG